MDKEKVMNPSVLYRLEKDLQPHFAHLGKWQVQGLAIAVLGLVSEGNCHLSGMAESLPSLGNPHTVKTRLKRWLTNPRIEKTDLSYAWLRWVFERFKTQRPILLVDETKLGTHLGVMIVSLAYGKRAIPLVWRCYHGNSAADYPQQGQVLLIYGLLAHVLSCLPAGMRPVVQMDRGLGHTSAMLKVLQALDVDFLVRVKSNAYFTTQRGRCQTLGNMIRKGTTFTARGTLFKKRPIPGYIRLIWQPDQTEPWCLFTNLRWLSGRQYAIRWWQEESFKDLKSGGWQWGDSKIRCPQRMDRLIFVMALAYAWMLSLGTQLTRASPTVKRPIVNTYDFQRLGLFRLGRRWFKRLLLLTPHQLRLQLIFRPPRLLGYG
ncbi:MAG TPA: transposase [Aggregatilineales bacterium]|nr:transposase [Aggregatilineales bacterium]